MNLLWYDEVRSRLERECGEAAPLEKTNAMGSVLWQSRSLSRSASLSRRVVAPTDESRAVSWCLWSDAGSLPVPEYRHAEPLCPDAAAIERVVHAMKAWLVEGREKASIEAAHGPGLPVDLDWDLAAGTTQSWGTRSKLAIEVTATGWTFWVGGRNLCERRLREGGARTSMPMDALHGLAVWLAREWKSVFFGVSQRPPAIADRSASPCRAYDQGVSLAIRDEVVEAQLEAWRVSHSIRAANPHLPNVFMERQADDLVLAWDAHASPEALFELPDGAESLPLPYALPLFRDVVKWVASTAALTNEQKALIGAATSEDPALGYEVLAAYREDLDVDWLKAHGIAESSARALAVTGVDRSPLVGLLRTSRAGGDLSAADLHEMIARLKPAKPGAYDRLRDAAQGLPTAMSPMEPWTSGYKLAPVIRKRFALPHQPIANVEGILRAFGVHLEEIALSSPDVHGICVGAAGIEPTAFINSASEAANGPSGKRVTQLHELCHLLFDRARMRGLAQVETAALGPTGVDPEQEKRANAFAVEFLLPMTNFVDLLSMKGEERQHALRELAGRFQLSMDAVEPHFGNFLNVYNVRLS